MPSPDARPYVDLTLLDVTADELLAGALEQLAARLPGWEPREAATEVLLLEAHAAMTQELVYAVNRLPGAVLEALLKLYGLDRSVGTGPTATVTVTALDALGVTIPAGTLLRVDLDDGIDPITVATDTELVIAPGDTTGTVDVTGTTPTTTANGTAIGTTLTPTSSAGIRSAELATGLTGGTDPEDGYAFLNRAAARLGRLTDTLVLPAHFTARALEVSPVYRAHTIDLYDADTDTPNTPGHVTVAVLAAAGVALTGPQITAVHDDLAAAALASLTIHVIDAEVTPVDVELEVHVLDGYVEATVTDAVIDAITAALDPDTWEWSDTVRRNELISIADRVTGVDYVADVLDAPAGAAFTDLTLTGVANLAAAGTITATAV